MKAVLTKTTVLNTIKMVSIEIMLKINRNLITKQSRLRQNQPKNNNCVEQLLLIVVSIPLEILKLELGVLNTFITE